MYRRNRPAKPKGNGRYRIGNDSIPQVNSPYWVEFCRPLFLYIMEKNRPWDEIQAWRKEKKLNGYFLRNALAWMEDHKYIDTYLPAHIEVSQLGAWVWRVTNSDACKAYAEKCNETNLPD